MGLRRFLGAWFHFLRHHPAYWITALALVAGFLVLVVLATVELAQVPMTYQVP